MCRDLVQDPAFAPGTSEGAAGLGPVCTLLFITARLHMRAVIFSP